MAKMTGLGRGLGSLIPTKHEPVLTSSSSSFGQEVLVSNICENPHQPRTHFSPSDLEDLIASIKEHGILQPLVVTESSPGQYELIAGERRLRSARLLGLETVPVIVRTATEQQKLELALIENIQRKDLNAIEEAIAYEALMNEFGLTQEDVARRVGKSRSVIANTVRLLDLSDEMRQALVDEKITKSHARTLLSEQDLGKREQLFRAILTNGMSVREVEARSSSPKKSAQVNTKKDPDILDHERRLRELFGTKVEIQDKQGSGKISIHYFSKEELRDLLQRLVD